MTSCTQFAMLELHLPQRELCSWEQFAMLELTHPKENFVLLG